MFSRIIGVQTSGILRVAYMHAVSSGPDLLIGYIGLSLWPQDPRVPWPSPAAGGPVVPGPHLNSAPPHFMFGPPNYHEAVELLCAVVDSQ